MAKKLCPPLREREDDFTVRDLPFLGPSPALALRFAPVLGTRHMIGEIVMTARRSVGGVETVEDVVGFVVRRKVLCVCVWLL